MQTNMEKNILRNSRMILWTEQVIETLLEMRLENNKNRAFIDFFFS